MPSAGRIVGAILVGLLAWYVSELYKPLMQEGTDFGHFSIYNAALGVLLGWVMLGYRAHSFRRSSVSAGLTAVAALVFWGLCLHSIAEMLKLSLRKAYDGPVEAVIGVAQLMIKYGAIMATPEMLVTLIVGGCVTGYLSGWAEQRWT